ncbi:hypothetical protein CHARACLAT_015395 [Characodon lateralis]|uniref:Uncharacterized protein n=1 Tax=Characodon lateralis TaxID=208331 RepID=A0ABU7DRC3_9TELE|nr:hypothetical protein [Characodon lateralis]
MQKFKYAVNTMILNYFRKAQTMALLCRVLMLMQNIPVNILFDTMETSNIRQDIRKRTVDRHMSGKVQRSTCDQTSTNIMGMFRKETGSVSQRWTGSDVKCVNNPKSKS